MKEESELVRSGTSLQNEGTNFLKEILNHLVHEYQRRLCKVSRDLSKVLSG
ncbi:MAG: hypothetical protein NZ853_05050 [Leptospiraceae bacterium]|nr:hypothetical protein [Leptospiraceae bacterium]